MGLFDDILNDGGAAAPKKRTSAGSGLFDDILAQPDPSSIARRVVGDSAISLLKGAISVPEAAVGIADIPTMGYAGKAAEAIGFRPREAKAALDELYTPEQQAANQRVQEAKGFLPTLGAAVQNPSVIGHAVLESLPSMGAGAVVGRGLLAAAPKIGAVGAGALGEGSIGAGMSAEGIRQQTADGTLTPGQAGAALASGVGTAALGAAGGKIAQKLGIGDIDTMLVGGTAQAGTRSLPARMAGGAISEGLLEEMPQSMQEQAWQNVALDKPVMEGVPEAGALGALAGGVMGIGGGIISGPAKKPAGALGKTVAAGEQSGAVQPIAGALPNYPLETQIVFPDGSTGTRKQFDDYLAGLPEDQRADAMAKMLNMGAQPSRTPEDIAQAQALAADANRSAKVRGAQLAQEEAGGIADLTKPAAVEAKKAPLTAEQREANRLAIEQEKAQGELPGRAVRTEQIQKAEAAPAQSAQQPTKESQDGQGQKTRLLSQSDGGAVKEAAPPPASVGLAVKQGDKPDAGGPGNTPKATDRAGTGLGRVLSALEKRYEDAKAAGDQTMMRTLAHAINAQKAPQQPKPEKPAAKAKGLTIGAAPGNAEPVTVRKGVIHIGDYPAQNFDSGEDVRVPEGANGRQIREALKAAGAIPRGHKIYGLQAEQDAGQPEQNTAKAEQNAPAKLGPQTPVETLIPPKAESAGAPDKAQSQGEFHGSEYTTTAAKWFKSNVEWLIKTYGYSAEHAAEARAADVGWDEHQDFLETALEEGKTIPESVLADYRENGRKIDPEWWPKLAKLLNTKTEPQAAAGTPAATAGGSRPAPAASVDEKAETTSAAAPEAAQDKAASVVDEKAHEAASSPQNDKPEPTKAQIEANNSPLGHVTISGMQISIENPEGSIRKDLKNDPPKWQTKMRAHYGYLIGTKDVTGEHIDVFVRPGTPSDYSGPIYVIDQVKANGHYDEYKVMVGWKSGAAARAGYLANYSKGWQGLGAITETTVADFKAWLAEGDTTKPFAEPGAPAPAAFKDGELRPESDLLAFYRQEIKGKEKGAVVPNTRFEIGRIDDATAAEVARFIEGYKGEQRRLRVSGRSLKHIEESRPKLAEDIIRNLSAFFTKPDEVLPDHRNPGKRALLVHNTQSVPEKRFTAATVEVEIEVEISDGFIDIVTVMTMPERSLKEARKLKENWREGQHLQAEAGNSPHPVAAEATHAEADLPNVPPVDSTVAQDATASEPAPQPPTADIDTELQDAMGHLGDVLGEVFGGQMNITGKQYGAGDLLPALSKVVELLVKKGYRSFRQSVSEAAKLMRANAKTAGFVDQVSARQWKAAYQAVAEFHEGTDSEDAVGALSALEVDELVGKTAAQEDRNAFTLERLNRDTNALEPVTFERGEWVSAHLDGGDRITGEIDGISHARSEAKLTGGDQWFEFGRIYKAERPEAPKKDTIPLSAAIEKANAKFGEGLTEADRVPTSPEEAAKAANRAKLDATRQRRAAEKESEADAEALAKIPAEHHDDARTIVRMANIARADSVTRPFTLQNLADSLAKQPEATDIQAAFKSTLEGRTKDAKDALMMRAQVAFSEAFGQMGSEPQTVAAVRNGSLDLSAQPWAADFYDLFKIDPAKIEKPAAPTGDELVDAQLAKFNAGVFDLPKPNAANLNTKDRKAEQAEATAAYVKAARLFLEGDLTAKVPTGKAETLDPQFLENLRVKAVERAVKRVKTYADQNKALFTIAAEGDVRWYLQGIHIDGKRMVVTDGHRLAMLDDANLSGLPAKTEKEADFTIINRYFGEKKGSISAEPNKQWLEGKFPDWTRVVPDAKQRPHAGTFDAARVSGLARGVQKAFRYFGAKHSIAYVEVDGIRVAVNAQYIADAADLFRAFGYPSFEMRVSSPNDSILMESPDGRLRQVVMGVRDNTVKPLFLPIVPDADVAKQAKVETVDAPAGPVETDALQSRGIDLLNRNVAADQVARAIVQAKAGDDSLLLDLERINGVEREEAEPAVESVAEPVAETGQAEQQPSPTAAPNQAAEDAEQQRKRENPNAKTTAVEHYETMDRLRSGTATLAEYKAAFARLAASEAEIKAELEKKTKDQLLQTGGYTFERQYKADKKDRVVDALYRDMLTDFAIGRSISYVLGTKGGMQASLAGMVEGTSEQTLREFADKIAAQRADHQERLAGAKDPKSMEDFENYIRIRKANGMSFTAARMTLTPEQRAAFDTMTATASRNQRKAWANQQKTDVRAAAVTTEGQVFETKHTKTGEPLFVVKSAERVERDVYNEWNATAKRLGGWYSSYRGAGAIPGFQFKTRENADAFLAYLGGNVSPAKEVAQTRRDEFADDKSQSAVERLNEMADRLDEKADESLSVDRKANTDRRARFAAAAESAAHQEKALATTMRNIARGIADGTVKFLDRVRTKAQVEMLRDMLGVAKGNELRAKYPSYGDELKHRGEPPTDETADHADWPSYTAFRSDLATLGRHLAERDGTKKLGAQLLKVAGDVSDAYREFAKKNMLKVSGFSTQDGKPAIFTTADAAEAAIARSGFKGKAIPFQVKRGQYAIIKSPEAAREAGIWEGDDDKRITLSAEFGDELVEKLARSGRRNGPEAPWQFVAARDKRKRLAALGIETPAEYRAMLREFAKLREAPNRPSRVKELERAMIGRAKDGLDFFPTPERVADEMVETAGIEPGMAVLEPSAGWGHIAERIRAAGVEPDVIEMSNDRAELLDAKGFNVIGRDFMDLSPRGFTYGDVFRHKDGTEGVMRGNGGLGSGRVGFEPVDGGVARWVDRDDLTGVRKSGTGSGYDRIVMNPPFSDRRDAEHVQHAYSLLKPGGRLVAIMGEGVFFGQDKKAQAFRDWLDSVGGTSEKLEDGTFLDPTLPVNTGVAARMVVIERDTADVQPAEDADMASRPATAQIPRGHTLDTVRAEIAETIGAGRLAALERKGLVKIHTDFRTMPAAAMQYPDAWGWFDGSTVHLVAGNLHTGQAAGVFQHEAWHHMLRGLKLSDSPLYAKIMDRLAKIEQNGAASKWFAEASRMIPQEDRANTARRLNELAAYAIQQYENEPKSLPVLIRRFVEDLVAGVRAFFMDALGWVPQNLTAADLVAITRRHVQAMAAGGPVAQPLAGEAMASSPGDDASAPQDAGIDFDPKPTTIEAAPAPIADENEFQTAARLFLSNFPEGARHSERSATARAARAASEAARWEFGSDAGRTRRISSRLGPFAGYETREQVLNGLNGHKMLVVNVYGEQQIEDGLGFAPALTVTVHEDGEFSVYGPPSHSALYKHMAKRGWAEPAADAAGNRFDTMDGGFWTRVTGVKYREVVGLLGDVHARTLDWRGVEHTGLHWKRTTGATGNLGGHVGAIYFSRPTSEFVQAAADRATDLFKTSKTFNLWHKTVGTQFHKASVDADFGRVFKIGQKFLQDVSQFAMDAADLAPSLLPKLGSIRDVFKRGPKKADLEAVSNTVFNGTLDNKLYSDAELAALGLNEKQRDLYREFRAATDKSIDDLFVAEMTRSLRTQFPDLGRRLVGMSAEDAHAVVIERLNEELAGQRFAARELPEGAKEKATAERMAADLKAQIKTSVDAFNKVQKLKGEGYAPLMRFGQYTVDVMGTDAAGEPERVAFFMFETEREANAAARKLAAADPALTVTQGVMSQEEWRMFQGVSPDSMELFATALGADQSEVFQKYLKMTLNNRSALKRLIRRTGVEGFSQDATRVLATFITSNSRLAARTLNVMPLKEAVDAIPKEKGDVKDEAVKLANYLTDPKEEAQALRGWMFVHFIGGSVASALTNMTQPLTMTAPYLAQWGSAKAGKALAAAAKLVARKSTGDVQLDSALAKAEAEGITAPHEIHQLYAESIRSLGSNAYFRKALTVWGSAFAVAEAFNRRLTFIAAFKMAQENPALGNAFAFAERAVEETQGIYNKGNRPDWARGAVGATVFTFKQFSIAYVEFLKRLPPKQRALALAILFLAAGLQGWPFAEDVQDLIDTIGQSFGYNTNSKRWMHEFAVRQLGEGMGEFVTHGFSAIPGVPLDVSARMGLGNLIPGTAMFKVSETDRSRDVLEFVGPAGSLVKSGMDAFSAVQQGRIGAAAAMAFPMAAQNIIKATDMAHSGEYRDRQGRKVTEVDGYDAAIKAIGFQPAKVAKDSRAVFQAKQSIDMARNVESSLADRWARGIIDQKPEDVRAARAELADWNQKNPESRIVITPRQIAQRVKEARMSRAQRFVKTAPRELRPMAMESLTGG